MPTRWVISPVEVVTVTEAIFEGLPVAIQPDSYRQPVVATLLDAGLPGKSIRWSTVISDGLEGQVNDWCLVFVRGTSLATVDAAPDVHSVVEEDDSTDREREDEGGILSQTPRELGWSAAKMQRVRDRLIAKGADITGITQDTPLRQILLRLARVIRPGITMAGLRDTWYR